MNAVIALCHFCEAHGPSAIFCTQTIRDTKILDDLSINFDENEKQFNSIKSCSICNSIGTKCGIISKDPDNNATFLSTQIPIIPDVRKLIKQASVRSLSCEVNCSKDDFIFFGDSTRGHVLSHTFHVNDLQARGFYQLFSIIILMKDKFFLLNIKPFLSENLKEISEELKSKAKVVYDTEQNENGSGRNRRLMDGENAVLSPRSLVELTNDKNIFYILHTHFTWILLAGTRILTEQITFCNVPWLPQKMMKFEKKLVPLTKDELCSDILENDKNSVDVDISSLQNTLISLRYLKNHLKSHFISACYCALTGTKIIIRGPIENIYTALMCFRRVLPEEMHKLTHFNSSQYLTHPDGKIVTVTIESPVPLPSSNLYRIDFINGGNVAIKWHGSIPEKLPSLLNKIVKAVDESLFTDLVLDKHLKVLIEEWKNKIICLNRVKSSKDVAKMKNVLGIQQQDLPLVNYWKSYF